MDAALDGLAAADGTQDGAATQQAANDLAYVVTDLRLRHEDPATVDAGRMDILARRLPLDASAEEQGFVTGDVRHLEALWSRISHTVQASAATSIEGLLSDLRAAAESADYTAAAEKAQALGQAVAGASDPKHRAPPVP